MAEPLYIRPLGHLSREAYYAEELDPDDEELGWSDDEPFNPEHEDDDAT